MKKQLFCLLLGFASAGLYADDTDCCGIYSDGTFEFTTGYRQDQLKVHVTPPTPDAPVASINNWKNVDIVQARMTLKAETAFNTYSRAYFNYGRLVEFGHEFISPTLNLDPAKTHHEKGRVYDAEYAFGLSWYPCDSFRLTPLTGYSYHRIEFESHNRVPRNIPVDSDEAEKYDYFKVVSKQRTTWRAPFVGLETELFLSNCTRICLNGQYLWAHYNNHGKGREKYNQTYRYKQYSNGSGVIFSGELGYTFLEGWEALLTGGYQYWEVKGGRDQTKYSGPAEVITKSHLNSVSWQSFEISLGIAYLY